MKSHKWGLGKNIVYIKKKIIREEGGSFEPFKILRITWTPLTPKPPLVFFTVRIPLHGQV